MDNFLCAMFYFLTMSLPCVNKGVATLPPLWEKKRDGWGEGADLLRLGLLNITEFYAHGVKGENRSSCVKLVVWPPFVTGGVARLTGYQSCGKRDYTENHERGRL